MSYIDGGAFKSTEEDEDYEFNQAYPAEGYSADQFGSAEVSMAPVANTSAAPADRPMTSIKAAGFNANAAAGKTQGAGGPTRPPAPALVKKADSSPEAAARELEKKVNQFIEESAIASAQGQHKLALEKAKEGVKKEKQLARQREQNGILDVMNLELTYAVYFNLANQFHRNGLYQEAISTYNLIVKNKQYALGGRMRVNMGNIYYEQKKYPAAIKQYRMAIDQIPNTAKDLRFKIMRNIGNSFIALGQYQDAVQAFETIMESSGDYRSGLNLVLCNYALKNVEKMKTSFGLLIGIRNQSKHDREKEEEEEAAGETEGDAVAPNDSLRQEIRERQKFADKYIIMAAKLIAPVVEGGNISAGFDYVVDTLRVTKNKDLASELEISKALTYMKNKEIEKAISTLKEFEKRDEGITASAATNLSFLYFLEGEYKLADKYATIATKADRYNAKAYVNKGNCFYVRGRWDEAKEMYQEALSCEADCVEALYNLGLTCKRMGAIDKALQYYGKLQAMIPNHPEVVFQIAALHEEQGDLKSAEREFKLLIKSLVPADPQIQSRLGAIYAKADDDLQALQYYMESYRFFPADLNVISWLGAYYVKSEVYEKAVDFFRRAAQLEPAEIKWQLMIASCYRRMRAFQQAMELYTAVHEKDPYNIEALRYLVQICTTLGLVQDQQDYMIKLRTAEQSHLNQNASEGDAADQLVGGFRKRAEAEGKPGLGGLRPPAGYKEPPKSSLRDKFDTSEQFKSRDDNMGIKKKIGVEEEDFGDDDGADTLLPL